MDKKFISDLIKMLLDFLLGCMLTGGRRVKIQNKNKTIKVTKINFNYTGEKGKPMATLSLFIELPTETKMRTSGYDEKVSHCHHQAVSLRE
jgi:hypothetical protein